MIPNLVWTALFLIPITIFCYAFMTPKTTYILLGLSLIPIFLPNSFFDRIQLSRSSHFYRKIGVKHINIFAQNGSLLNKFLKRKYPNFKVVSKSKTSIKKQYYQTYFFEKFHFSLFVFFTIIVAKGILLLPLTTRPVTWAAARKGIKIIESKIARFIYFVLGLISL